MQTGAKAVTQPDREAASGSAVAGISAGKRYTIKPFEVSWTWTHSSREYDIRQRFYRAELERALTPIFRHWVENYFPVVTGTGAETPKP